MIVSASGWISPESLGGYHRNINKLERLLRLMKMLTANNSLTVDEIADKLGISSRSVYRYIDTFRDAGFVIKKRITAPSSTSLRLISKTLAGSFTSPKKKTTISSSPLSKALTKTTAVDKLLPVLRPRYVIAKLERMGADLTIQTQPGIRDLLGLANKSTDEYLQR
ncbi:HTH domain-containing protein [Seramator thermalis]|uniref:HTH domain-containing protein n=1 Tax=Seramator thermalis TaxID=2496270 RepID=UPI002939106A|nr:HTH domain-containing protein [Seramator thermalis]